MYNRELIVKGLLGKIDWMVANKRSSEELRHTITVLLDYLERNSSKELLEEIYIDLMKRLA